MIFGSTDMQEPHVTPERDPLRSRLVHGVSRLADVLRNNAWTSAQQRGLTPTQGRILVLLRTRGRSGLRLAEIAAEIGVTAPTASDAVTSLVDKGLVEKRAAEDDGRAISVTLTREGRREAYRAMHWSDFLLEAFEPLSEPERRVMLRGLSKALRRLAEIAEIPMPRMCLTCGFFRPYANDDAAEPHGCAFGDFAFGEEDLRLDCTAQETADPADLDEISRRFDRLGGGELGAVEHDGSDNSTPGGSR